MTISHNRAVATLKLPVSVPRLITTVAMVLQKMTGNPHFPSPTPSLSTVKAALDELEAAEVAALRRGVDTVSRRESKRVALISLMEQLRAYVQRIADASPEESAGIIMSAGMSVKRHPGGPKRSFVVRHGDVSGSVKVMARTAAKRASYDWEVSTDGGATWRALPSTLRATMHASGFTPATRVSFRYRALTKDGLSDWSQPVEIIVL